MRLFEGDSRKVIPMFTFRGLLKEALDEGNSRELDGTLNGGKTRVEREKETQTVRHPGRCLQRRPRLPNIKRAVQVLNRVANSHDFLVKTVYVLPPFGD